MKSRGKKCQKCREAIELDAIDFAAEEHLAGCADCRAYAGQLRAMTDGLRRLSAQPIQPALGFHRRWTMAVETASEPSWAARAAALLSQWSWGMAQRNRWALPTLAPLWVMILLFKFTAPEVASPPPTTVARSPVDIFRALRSETNIQMAFDHLPPEAPLKDPAGSPRGNRSTAQPMT